MPFKNVEACIDKHGPEQALPSKTFQPAFTGKSSNNAGFLTAILRAEGLLSAAPDGEGRHIIAGNWAEWKSSVLALAGQKIEAAAPSVAEASKEDAATASNDTSNPGESPRRKK
ncbi:hypothetical protein H3H36_12955 [Duganella sp. FT3S]|uniref:Uncharacterized protein n=1 Tax=Rugamonas fusca TaxID=2758568 RepID=A0A7W2EHY5_9BURK|nr:hypothetical protein [Rugamonas fusca]MBA5606263.1 hypothetical protein [Rugamonas fusca]